MYSLCRCQTPTLLAWKPASFHHPCLDLIQCINLACMSRALRSDNMENYLGSIRKLHLAPVQGLRRQVWPKQCILLLILDYRARQQSDDLSHRCWYSFLVTGLAAFSSDSADAWSQVWGWGSIMEDLWCFGHGRLQMCLCMVHIRSGHHVYVSWVCIVKGDVRCMNACVYMCVCRCCAALRGLNGVHGEGFFHWL